MRLISNLIGSLNMAIKYKLKFIWLKKSFQVVDCLDILFKKGIIYGYTVNNGYVKIFLNLGIKNMVLKNISTSSNPVFLKKHELFDSNSSNSFYIVSTTSGLMLDKEALINELGGKVIAKCYWN